MAREDVDEIIAFNEQTYSEEFEKSFDALQQAWLMAEARNAGKAFANYMRLMTKVPDSDKDETEVTETEAAKSKVPDIKENNE